MDFAEYWQYTDAVTKFLFFALLALSVASWFTGIIRLYQSHQLKKAVAEDLMKAVNSQSTELEGLSSSERKTVTEQTLMQHIGRYRDKGEQGMSILGTTAAIAPFIGLFGTVWGIFHALHSIGQTGQAGLSQVAGPVGEALIMTGLGLAVALPAVIFYNIALRLNRRTLYVANDTAYGLLRETAKKNGANTSNSKQTTALANNNQSYVGSMSTSTAG
ncbi:MotA/TolQ/ExbB proton channel family protein [Psychrobacter sp. F1192]|uniref:Biopolymer transport protein ExbB n=1 Tax=Psychrobacter coccoides TaxID=2818440 RepID=A0ABS3NMC9_9GAMM|nr:MotA/TolQ/ExbB proton channel family protein [Psychrobacter coccoides]MBO1530567.1 MotA/TolQ/ExbB proton channel family protein [Psychrobacter coccoides]